MHMGVPSDFSEDELMLRVILRREHPHQSPILICADNPVSVRLQQTSSEMSSNKKLASQKSHEARQTGLA